MLAHSWQNHPDNRQPTSHLRQGGANAASLFTRIRGLRKIATENDNDDDDEDDDDDAHEDDDDDDDDDGDGDDDDDDADDAEQQVSQIRDT